MSLISYMIRHKNADLTDDVKAMRYPHAGTAWAEIRRQPGCEGMSVKQLKAAGWRVKMNIDERQVITEAAEIGLDMAPIPTPAKGLLGGLIGKLFGRKN